MIRNLLAGAALGASLTMMTALPAEARRTVVDFGPDDPDMEFPNTTDIGGYCDFDGTECGVTPLGFTVDFGNGQGPVNSTVAFGNGMLAFTNAPGDADALVSGTYDATIVTGGAISTASDDFVFNYSFTHGVFAGTDGLSLSFYSCESTTTCYIPLWDFSLAPQDDGFVATVTYYGNRFGEWSPGFTIPGGASGSGQVADVKGGSYQFFVPATITGLAPSVPEPATWAMMILGFALVGGMLRTRKGVDAVGGRRWIAA